MPTPFSQAAHSGIVPSSSYLQQLLEEIQGAATPTVLRDRPSPPSPPSATPSRRSSSVWIGGASIARDARDKLRAADQAHYGLPSTDIDNAARTLDGLTAPTSSPQCNLNTHERTFESHEYRTGKTSTADHSPSSIEDRPKAASKPMTYCHRPKFGRSHSPKASAPDFAPC